MCKMNQSTSFTDTPMDEVVGVCDSEDEELSFGDRMKTPFLINASTLIIHFASKKNTLLINRGWLHLGISVLSVNVVNPPRPPAATRIF